MSQNFQSGVPLPFHPIVLSLSQIPFWVNAVKAGRICLPQQGKQDSIATVNRETSANVLDDIR
jgi:hypothetical protein